MHCHSPYISLHSLTYSFIQHILPSSPWEILGPGPESVPGFALEELPVWEGEVGERPGYSHIGVMCNNGGSTGPRLRGQGRLLGGGEALPGP